LPVLVGVLGIAGLADYFHHLPLDHAGNRVIQQKAAARTIIVNQVAKTQRGLKHNMTSEDKIARVYSESEPIIAFTGEKSTQSATLLLWAFEELRGQLGSARS
jgi:hypothetical protein